MNGGDENDLWVIILTVDKEHALFFFGLFPFPVFTIIFTSLRNFSMNRVSYFIVLFDSLFMCILSNK